MQIDKKKYKLKPRYRHRRGNLYTDGQQEMGIQTDRQTDGRKKGLAGGWTYGQMPQWKDGWVDG